MKKHAVWLVAAALLSSLGACSRVAATGQDGARLPPIHASVW
ncbi:hypothetical protein [Luteimonas suaedae]|nr:hypothetical protein [Luteimonas suaedae]